MWRSRPPDEWRNVRTRGIAAATVIGVGLFVAGCGEDEDERAAKAVRLEVEGFDEPLEMTSGGSLGGGYTATYDLPASAPLPPDLVVTVIEPDDRTEEVTFELVRPDEDPDVQPLSEFRRGACVYGLVYLLQSGQGGIRLSVTCS